MDYIHHLWRWNRVFRKSAHKFQTPWNHPKERMQHSTVTLLITPIHFCGNESAMACSKSRWKAANQSKDWGIRRRRRRRRRKRNKTKVVEEHCWMITYVAREGCECHLGAHQVPLCYSLDFSQPPFHTHVQLAISVINSDMREFPIAQDLLERN